MFKKILDFFFGVKTTIANIELKTQAYIKKNSKQIRLVMSLLEVLFPAGTGIKKMSCLVTTVCYAMGLEKITPQIADYVTAELQKQYDKFKKELEN